MYSKKLKCVERRSVLSDVDKGYSMKAATLVKETLIIPKLLPSVHTI